jgi:hypothetical protein
MSIPKIIHQIWIGQRPAPTKMMNTWKEKHPDFEYILWTEAEIEKRGIKFESQAKIDSVRELCGKADIIRYEILWKYGGYYIDADSICIEPLDSYITDKRAFAIYENEVVRKDLVANGILGAVPGYPLFRDMLAWIKSDESTPLIANYRAWFAVGPALLTRFLDTGKYSDFSVFPSHCFLPNHFTGEIYTGHKKVYSYQEWGSTKENYEVMNTIELPDIYKTPSLWVSILITSYNTKPIQVNECLESIRNQKGYFGIEVVWINDGSDELCTRILEEQLKKFERGSRFIKVVYDHIQSNSGTPTACNRGIELCSNELIFKMDSDDIMLPERLAKQINYMTENPGCQLCGTNIHLFANPNPTSPKEKHFMRQTNHPVKLTWDEFYKTRSDWFVNHPTICYRKKALQELGGYSLDPRFRKLYHDYELIVRFLGKYDYVTNLPDVLLLYRLHDNQLTRDLKGTGEYEEWRKEIIDKVAKFRK